MTAHVMTDGFLAGMAESRAESGAASRMRKLMGAFTAHRQSPSVGDRSVTANADDHHYAAESAAVADELALLVEEHEVSVEEAMPAWSGEAPADPVADGNRDYGNDLPPGRYDEQSELVSDGGQKAEHINGTPWDELTPLDIERARTALAARRDKMLARHADELQALDHDKEEVANLADAVALFMLRFAPAADPEAEAVAEMSVPAAD